MESYFSQLQSLQKENAELYARVSALRKQQKKTKEESDDFTQIQLYQDQIAEVKHNICKADAENIQLKHQLRDLRKKQSHYLKALEEKKQEHTQDLLPKLQEQERLVEKYFLDVLSYCQPSSDVDEISKLINEVSRKRAEIRTSHEKLERIQKQYEFLFQKQDGDQAEIGPNVTEISKKITSNFQSHKRSPLESIDSEK